MDMMDTEKPLILAVDDSVENLQVLTAMLKDRFRLKVAKSGERAWEIANEEHKPDLILMDVLMPGMDGFETCRRLKANPATARIPVIFITALNMVADETRGFQAGGADFITKPFNQDVVLARIRTHIDLQAEKRKSDTLLKILLPENVIDDLIRHGKYEPEMHEHVSIMFLDFVGFTGIAATMTPARLIEELSGIFSEFDDICQRHGATRIKTIGDAYMAATGLQGHDPDHAKKLVNTGLDFLEHLNHRNAVRDKSWHCRIGIHSGKVIAGIIGRTRYVYDILGDSVNIAARVESAGRNMRITITETTRMLIGDDYRTEPHGHVHLKGVGEMLLHSIV